MVNAAVAHRAEGRGKLQTTEGGNQLFGVGATGFFHAFGQRLDGVVANHRADPRIILETRLISRKKRLMLGRLDGVPRIAGHHPAFGCFVLERVQILRLASQQAGHRSIAKQATGIALAHKLGEIGGKKYVEDGVRLGISERLHHAAHIDLAQWRRLFGDEFDVRLCGLEQGLEGFHCRLAVFIVGIDQRPSFLFHRHHLRHQHRHLHVGRRTQAEGVAIATLPDQLVGQRLAGQKKDLFLPGIVGQRQTDV